MDFNFDINKLRQMALLGQSPSYGDDQGITTPTDNLANLPSSYPANLNISGDNPPGLTSGLLNLPPEESESDKFGRMMREQYHPSSSANDRLNALLDQYPHDEKPGLGRTLVAISAGLGHGGVGAGQQILDEPHNKALADWKNQVEPAGKAAEIERQGNVNERYIASQTINSMLGQQRIDALNQKNQDANEIAKGKLAISQLLAEGNAFDTKGQYIMVLPKDGSPPYNSGVLTTHFDPMEKARLDATTRVTVGAGHDAARVEASKIGATTAQSKAATTMMAPDEEGNMVPYVFNPITKTYERYTNAAGEQATGPVYKPGAQSASSDPNALTVQTRNQIQGSRALLPQVADVSELAARLQKNGQFGVAMSRLRDAAATLGTTGDYRNDAQTLDQISKLIDSKEFNPSGDFTLGQFQMALGGLASGAARVHSRTGGSMGMINHFKALLSPTSTYDMFNGRLLQLQKLLTDYATQGGPATVKKKPAGNLDSDLDKIFGKAPPVK